MAVLHAGPTALIGGLSAAEVHGMRNWHRDDITVVVDDVLQAMDDRARHRKLTDDRTVIVHCSAYEIRYQPGSVMEDLIALGVPRAS